MASRSLSDDIGSIIAGGAIDAGVRELAELGDIGGLIGWIESKFPNLSEGNRITLQSVISEAAIAGGAYDPDDTGALPDLDSIPIAPTVLGSSDTGNRYRVSFDVVYYDESIGRNRSIAIRGSFATLPTWDDLAAAGVDYLNQLFEMYPEKFPYHEEQGQEEIEVNVFGIARAY